MLKEEHIAPVIVALLFLDVDICASMHILTFSQVLYKTKCAFMHVEFTQK